MFTCRAAGPGSLQVLEEGRQGPLVGSPLGPRGAGLGLLLFPTRVLGLKPPSGLSFGCWFVVQAFSRGDTWHLGLWVLSVLSAFYPRIDTFLCLFSSSSFLFAPNRTQGDQAPCLSFLPSYLLLEP